MNKKKLTKFLTMIYRKYSFLRSPMTFIYNRVFLKPRFSGWGMTIDCELPWNDEYDWQIFRQAGEDIKNNSSLQETQVVSIVITLIHHYGDIG